MRWLYPFLLLPGLALAQTPAEKRASADKLLTDLRQAPSSEAASALEQRIQQIWIDSGTASVTLLMHRGLRELQAESNNAAIDTFSDVIVLDPTLAAAWHRRGIARFQIGDTAGAVSDFQEAVALEPRNFAVWRTLCDIAVQREDWHTAYGAWQKMMAIDPKTPDGDKRLRELKRKAVGEDT
jgi:lipoprotein NlpI